MSPTRPAGRPAIDTFVTLALPTADRRAAYDFHRALGHDTPGEPAEDGIPEPLRVALNAGVEVMYIPTGGFGWVTAGRPVADRGTTGCLVSVALADRAAVDALAARAAASGGEVVSGPAQQPWGTYTCLLADPDGHLWEAAAPPG